MYTQATNHSNPPPRQTSHNQYKPVRLGSHQLWLDPTESYWIPLHNTTCYYITIAYINRETACLIIRIYLEILRESCILWGMINNYNINYKYRLYFLFTKRIQKKGTLRYLKVHNKTAKERGFRLRWLLKNPSIGESANLFSSLTFFLQWLEYFGWWSLYQYIPGRYFKLLKEQFDRTYPLPFRMQNSDLSCRIWYFPIIRSTCDMLHLSSNFKHLKTLQLDNNGLKRIVEDDFFGLDELNCLDLSQNKIKILPMRTFLHTRNLTDLRLYGNNLIKVEPFVSLPFLKTLDLSQNKLVNCNP